LAKITKKRRIGKDNIPEREYFSGGREDMSRILVNIATREYFSKKMQQKENVI